jgi:hypothetical protein
MAAYVSTSPGTESGPHVATESTESTETCLAGDAAYDLIASASSLRRLVQERMAYTMNRVMTRVTTPVQASSAPNSRVDPV